MRIGRLGEDRERRWRALRLKAERRYGELLGAADRGSRSVSGAHTPAERTARPPRIKERPSPRERLRPVSRLAAVQTGHRLRQRDRPSDGERKTARASISKQHAQRPRRRRIRRRTRLQTLHPPRERQPASVPATPLPPARHAHADPHHHLGDRPVDPADAARASLQPQCDSHAQTA